MRNWGRTVVAIGIVAVGVLGTVGCAPEPTPAATPIGFANEAEAFAAAEATYRAYVDALNQVDLSDPETFEAVYAWTTGDANAGARESFSQMHADGWIVQGLSAFDGFAAVSFDSQRNPVVLAEICLDVTAVEVRDGNGESVVPDDRIDRQPALVYFDLAPSPTGLAIEGSEAANGSSCGG